MNHVCHDTGRHITHGSRGEHRHILRRRYGASSPASSSRFTVPHNLRARSTKLGCRNMISASLYLATSGSKIFLRLVGEDTSKRGRPENASHVMTRTSTGHGEHEVTVYRYSMMIQR